MALGKINIECKSQTSFFGILHNLCAISAKVIRSSSGVGFGLA